MNKNTWIFNILGKKGWILNIILIIIEYKTYTMLTAANKEFNHIAYDFVAFMIFALAIIHLVLLCIVLIVSPDVVKNNNT